MHDLHELVRYFPGHIRGDTEATGNLKVGNAAFCLCDMVDCTKPDFQRQFGGMEYCSSDMGGLRTVCGALIQDSGFNNAVFCVTTYRAGKAFRPTPPEESFPALDLGSVETFKIRITHSFLKLNMITWYIHLPYFVYKSNFSNLVYGMSIMNNYVMLCCQNRCEDTCKKTNYSPQKDI